MHVQYCQRSYFLSIMWWIVDTTASSMPSFDDLDEMFSSAESDLMTNNTDGSFIEQPVTLKADPRDEQREEDLLKIAHFRQLLVTETARLNTLCDKWEVINKESYPPDEGLSSIMCVLLHTFKNIFYIDVQSYLLLKLFES